MPVAETPEYLTQAIARYRRLFRAAIYSVATVYTRKNEATPTVRQHDRGRQPTWEIR